MNTVLISVIIPVYNVAEYLPQCLDSVLSQDYTALEIICVDDCSTDNSLEILESYAQKDSRIKIIRNSSNQHVGICRNIGLNYATGEYIHFLDPDDWINAGGYTKLAEKLKNIPDLEILYFQYKTFNNITKEFQDVDYEAPLCINKVLNLSSDVEAFDNWDRFCWCKLIKREFLLNNGIAFKNYRSLSDVEWAASLYVNCKRLCYIEDSIVNYRTFRTGSLVRIVSERYKDVLKSFINNKKLYKRLKPEIKYRLLGFDYLVLKRIIEEAYMKGYISPLELALILLRINTRDFKNYIYEDFYSTDYLLKVKFWKLVLNKINSNFYKKMIDFKKKLRLNL